MSFSYFFRRAATFLFSKGRYEEGAAMFTRALEVYNTALKKPFKDVRTVSPSNISAPLCIA